MIVDPDFLDHWRTRMLVDALGDELAPLYVLRVWAHCQSRRATLFDGMTSNGLKALCRYSGDGEKLEKSMIDAGFISRIEATISVPKWATHNASLIANWTNGRGGGRPPKEPKDNPSKTHGLATDNPPVTDKRREEKKKQKTNGASAFAVPEWIPEDAWDAFEEMRKKKRNPLTDRARQLAVAELQRLRDDGNDPRAVIEKSVLKGWQSFYPMSGFQRPNGASSTPWETGV